MEEKSKQKEKDQSASKLERILCSHSLQGLVYQKRQRKQFVNAFAQPTNNKKSKLTHHRTLKTKNKKETMQEKKKEKSKEKHIQNIKKRENKQSQKNQQIINEGKDNQQPKKRGRPRKVVNPQTTQNKKQQLNIQNQNQEIQQKQREPKQQQQQQISQQSNHQESQQQQFNEKQVKKAHKKEAIKNKSQPKQINIQNKNNSKYKSRGRPKSKLKINRFQRKNINKNENTLNIVNHEKEESVQKQNILQESSKNKQQNQISSLKNQNFSKSNEQDQAKEQQQNQGNQKSKQQNQSGKSNQIQQKNIIGRRLLRFRRKIQNKLKQKNKSIQNDENNNEEQQQNEDKSDVGKTRKLRQRKTKDEAIKKMMYEGYSDNQDPQFYQTRRKKGGGASEKEYQINRIFRKTQKLNLPSIKLDVDIMNFSLEQFAEKFNSFDMIHCSLPLDMLIKMPNISSLIPKGFIFIWVEKGEIQIGYHWLNRIGFDVIDQIMWIKTNEMVNEVKYDENTDDEIFPNCRSTCLVGYKCSASQRTEYCTKISNNIIFSPDRPASIEKPDEIYEIGDLMMPGAKKLQVGCKEIGGWLTLKHRQQTYARCHQCFRKDNRSLFLLPSKQIKCEFCLIHSMKTKQQIVQPMKQNRMQAANDMQLYSKLLSLPNTHKLQIVNKRFAQSLGCVCRKCQKSAPQLLQIVGEGKSEQVQQANKGEEQRQISLYCKQCLEIPPQASQIRVHNLKQIYFPKKYIKCSKCSKNQLQKYYFECFSCKNEHVLCSECLLSIPLEEQSANKSHEWKLRILNEFPEMRTVCFICAEQCMIPYWGCETCQNWYWCGRCDSSQKPKMHQHHCHYTRDHNLHLIV